MAWQVLLGMFAASARSVSDSGRWLAWKASKMSMTRSIAVTPDMALPFLQRFGT
ncbi:hypothetical protein D3C86_2177310 [compost metagenome]